MNSFRIKPPRGSRINPGDALAPGLIAAYQFNEGFGTKVADTSLPGRTTQSLTAFNGMGWAKTPYGPGVDGGAGGYWQGSLAPAFPGSGRAFTVSMRCMLRSITNSVNSAVVDLNGAAQSFTCQMALVGGIYYAATDSVTWNLTIATPPPLNVWQELTWTSDGINTVRFLVDGVQFGAATVSLTNAALTTITVGRRISQSGESDAIHSRLLIWNRVIPDKQIARLAPDPSRMFRRRFMPLVVSAASTNGTASITEAADTVSGAGTVAAVGTGSITEGADTLSAIDAVADTGTLAVTEAADSPVGIATVAVAATSAIANANDTLAAAASPTLSAAASVTESPDTLSALDAVADVGAAGVTENPDTVVGGAGSDTSGAASIAEGADSLSSLGGVAVAGAFSRTEAADTLSAIDAVADLASLAVTEFPDTLVGASAVAVSGVLAVTENPDSLSAIVFLPLSAMLLLTEHADTVVSAGSSSGSPVAGTITGYMDSSDRITGYMDSSDRITGHLV
jgi:hypothetical protein